MSKPSSLVKWVATAIAAPIIVALAIYWGQHLIDKSSKPAPQPAPQPEIVSINGRVIDPAASKLIDNAVVQLEVQATREQQQTDSEGRFAFSIQGFDPRLAATLSIKAPGYRLWSSNAVLAELGQMQDCNLTPETPSPAPPPAHGAVIGKYVVRPDVHKLIAPAH